MRKGVRRTGQGRSLFAGLQPIRVSDEKRVRLDAIGVVPRGIAFVPHCSARLANVGHGFVPRSVRKLIPPLRGAVGDDRVKPAARTGGPALGADAILGYAAPHETSTAVACGP